MTNGQPNETEKQEQEPGAQAEAPKRKKLAELETTPEIMVAFQKMIVERVQNMTVVTQSGASPSQCLIGEIVVLEAKIDALMLLLEEQGIDFTKYNKYLEEAALRGAATAVNIRKQMLMKR